MTYEQIERWILHEIRHGFYKEPYLIKTLLGQHPEGDPDLFQSVLHGLEREGRVKVTVSGLLYVPSTQPPPIPKSKPKADCQPNFFETTSRGAAKCRKTKK